MTETDIVEHHLHTSKKLADAWQEDTVTVLPLLTYLSTDNHCQSVLAIYTYTFKSLARKGGEHKECKCKL